jgi:hypothetical protein
MEKNKKISTYIALIDLVGWTKSFIRDPEKAIEDLLIFQRKARYTLEGDSHLSYVVTFADSVWSRCPRTPNNIPIFIDKVIEVCKDAKNMGFEPWAVITSGWMTYDFSDQTLISGGDITDICSQHITGIGDAQVRAGSAEKTRELRTGVVWIEKELIEEINGLFVETRDLSANIEKWPFGKDRSVFSAVVLT